MGSQIGRKLHLVYRESEDGISLITSPERAMEIDRLRVRGPKHEVPEAGRRQRCRPATP
jgi:hypothetical protein